MVWQQIQTSVFIEGKDMVLDSCWPNSGCMVCH